MITINNSNGISKSMDKIVAPMAYAAWRINSNWPRQNTLIFTAVHSKYNRKLQLTTAMSKKDRKKFEICPRDKHNNKYANDFFARCTASFYNNVLESTKNSMVKT